MITAVTLPRPDTSITITIILEYRGENEDDRALPSDIKMGPCGRHNFRLDVKSEKLKTGQNLISDATTQLAVDFTKAWLEGQIAAILCSALKEHVIEEVLRPNMVFAT